MLRLAVCAVLSLLTVTAGAQNQATGTQDKPTRLTFDVISIHPSDPSQQGGGIKPIAGGHGYTARNIPVKLMISLMYKIPARQIKGGPEWLDSARWDVEARADGTYNIDDLHTMYQNLLADRFGLTFHKEVKEGNIYALTVDPAGMKMKLNTSPQDYAIPVQGPPTRIAGIRVPMTYLTWFLGQNLQNDERPVVDMTGLTGNYDFVMAFQPQLPPGAPPDALPPEFRDLPNIFTAVHDQLGLKLTAQKGPIDYFVIDRVEKPSDN
jgi:uncharacterized protein (TIGR03435 family)